MPWWPDCHYDWFHAEDHTLAHTHTHILIVLKFRNATGHAAPVFQPPRRINASLKESPGCHGNICQKSLHVVSGAFSARSLPPTAAPPLFPVTVHHHLPLPLQASETIAAEKVRRLTWNDGSESQEEGLCAGVWTEGCVSVGGGRLKKIICFSFRN